MSSRAKDIRIEFRNHWFGYIGGPPSNARVTTGPTLCKANALPPTYSSGPWAHKLKQWLLVPSEDILLKIFSSSGFCAPPLFWGSHWDSMGCQGSNRQTPLPLCYRSLVQVLLANRKWLLTKVWMLLKIVHKDVNCSFVTDRTFRSYACDECGVFFFLNI